MKDYDYGQADLQLAYAGSDAINDRRRQITLFCAMFVEELCGLVRRNEEKYLTESLAADVFDEKGEWIGFLTVDYRRGYLLITSGLRGKTVENVVKGDSLPKYLVEPVWNALPGLLSNCTNAVPELEKTVEFYKRARAQIVGFKR
jgi:hypothetical protein